VRPISHDRHTYASHRRVLTLLYCAGHTLGMPWTPVIRPQDIAVLEAMKADQFDVTGASRTYWDFYVGFGLAITGFLALQAVVLWQLAPLARNVPTQIRPIIGAFFIVFLANTIIVWMCFFLIPIGFFRGDYNMPCLGIRPRTTGRGSLDERRMELVGGFIG